MKLFFIQLYDNIVCCFLFTSNNIFLNNKYDGCLRLEKQKKKDPIFEDK
jgi:hypothetical protein